MTYGTASSSPIIAPDESPMDQDTSTTEAQEEKPPILESWRRLYGVVLLELGVLIVLFYLFTKAFE